MKNLFRWIGFTIAVALIGLVIAFGLLIVGRLYLGLQQAAVVFTVLMFYSIGVTIAAINFASKLEDEAGEEAEIGGRLTVPTRTLARGEPLDD